MLPLAGERKNAKGIVFEKSETGNTLRGSSTLKRGLAHMLKNGVVMDVTTVEQAHIAEDAGAVSVMVLDKLHLMLEKLEELQEQQALELFKILWIQLPSPSWQSVE